MTRRAFRWVTYITTLSLIAGGGCASLHSGSASDALAQWRLGSKVKALAMVDAVYRRFRVDNGGVQTTIEGLARRALHTLATEPVIVRGDKPLGRPKPGEDAADRLLRRLRADLLSDRPTAVLRAIATVRAFKLRRRVPELVIVVYRRRPYRSDGGLLSEVSNAERTLALKWVALGALRTLAR